MKVPQDNLCACDPRLLRDRLNDLPICATYTVADEEKGMSSWDEPCIVCGHKLECHTRRDLAARKPEVSS